MATRMEEYTCFYCYETFKSGHQWTQHSTTCKVMVPIAHHAREIVKHDKQVGQTSYDMPYQADE